MIHDRDKNGLRRISKQFVPDSQRKKKTREKPEKKIFQKS